MNKGTLCILKGCLWKGDLIVSTVDLFFFALTIINSLNGNFNLEKLSELIISFPWGSNSLI